MKKVLLAMFLVSGMAYGEEIVRNSVSVNTYNTTAVTIAGNQTITGTKTFSTPTYIGTGKGVSTATVNSDGLSQIQTYQVNTTSLSVAGTSNFGGNMAINTITSSVTINSTDTPLKLRRSVAGTCSLLNLRNYEGNLNSRADINFGITSGDNTTMAQISTKRTNHGTDGDMDIEFYRNLLGGLSMGFSVADVNKSITSLTVGTGVNISTINATGGMQLSGDLALTGGATVQGLINVIGTLLTNGQAPTAGQSLKMFTSSMSWGN